MRRRLLPVLLLTSLVLAACATGPRPATVQVFTTPVALAAGAGFRFEPLPLQAGQPGYAQLEAAATVALARAGLRRDDAAPRYAVQLSAGQDPVASGPFGAGGGPAIGIGIGGGSRGGGIGIGLGVPIGGGVARAAQRVEVVLREVATGQVVYQAQASAGAGASPAALVDAALQAFPNVPPGVRQVPLAGR